MKLIYQATTKVTEHEHRFQLQDGSVISYKEWVHHSDGIVHDSQIRSENGHEINDPELLEQILQFLELYVAVSSDINYSNIAFNFTNNGMY